MVHQRNVERCRLKWGYKLGHITYEDAESEYAALYSQRKTELGVGDRSTIALAIERAIHLMSRAEQDERHTTAEEQDNEEEDEEEQEHEASAAAAGREKLADVYRQKLEEALRLLLEARGNTKNTRYAEERIKPRIEMVRRLLAKRRRRK